MTRYLLLANQTLGGEALMERVREFLARGPCEFYIVVPATPAGGGGVATAGGAAEVGGTQHESETDRVYRHADDRLRWAMATFKDLGVDSVDGEVGPEDPLDAFDEAFRGRQVDEVIVSTLPQNVSKWLKMDLASKVRRRVEIPVTHVEGPAGGPVD